MLLERCGFSSVSLLRPWLGGSLSVGPECGQLAVCRDQGMGGQGVEGAPGELPTSGEMGTGEVLTVSAHKDSKISRWRKKPSSPLLVQIGGGTRQRQTLPFCPGLAEEMGFETRVCHSPR